MEFIEYYRIIRRRIWIAVVMAAIIASVVVATRLVPRETVYTGVGRLLVHDIAKRRVSVAGNELFIGLPDRGEQFWNEIRQFVSSTELRRMAAQDLDIVGVEVESRLKRAEVRQLEGSNVLQVTAGADSNDLAVELCNAVMRHIPETWRSRQVAHIQMARQILSDRLPALREEVTLLETEADKLTAPYQGSRPTDVLDGMNTELANIQSQTAAAEMSTATAQARLSTAEEMAQKAPAEAARGRIGRAVSPRVQALQQEILQKQIELDGVRSRRTSEHQEVRALEAQIAALQQRLEAVEEEEEAGEEQVVPELSVLLQQTAAAAEVDAAALMRQRELLQERATEIHKELPAVQADSRTFEGINTELTAARETYAALQANIDRLKAEEEQLQETSVMEVLDEATAQRMPRGLVQFVMKLGVAIAAGGGLGILIIFVLHYVDFSFQDEEEAERMLGVRVLAGIPRSDVVLRSAEPAIPYSAEEAQQEAEPKEEPPQA